MSDRSHLVNHRNSVADLTLESAAGPISFGRRRGSTVVVLIHDQACTACRAYIDELEREKTELQTWDADVAAVVMSSAQRFADVAGIEPPGVVVVDQWADISEARAAGSQHVFPSIAEIVTAVRYLAMQCPECEGETA